MFYYFETEVEQCFEIVAEREISAHLNIYFTEKKINKEKQKVINL